MSIHTTTTDVFDRTRLDDTPDRQWKVLSQKNLARHKLSPILPKMSYRNGEEVIAFLTMHPGLNKFIEAASPALTKHFGDGVEVVLEVIDYPYANAESELVGWVQITGSIQDSLKKFDQFVDEWFLDHMAEVTHRFNFNVEIL